MNAKRSGPFEVPEVMGKNVLNPNLPYLFRMRLAFYVSLLITVVEHPEDKSLPKSI